MKSLKGALVAAAFILLIHWVPAHAAETIRYLTWMPTDPLITEEFQKVRPDITVDYQLGGGQSALLETILVNLAGGVNVDMALTHTHWLQNLVDADLLMDLRPLIERDGVDIGEFPPAVMDSYRGPGGEIFAFPMQWTTIVLVYNKDYMDRFGVAHPTDDWDVFDMESVGRRLTFATNENEIAGWGLGLQNLHEYVWRLWGVPFADESRSRSGWEDPRAVEAWEWYQGLFEEPLINNNWDQWVAGRVGMRLGWPHYIVRYGAELNDAWDVAHHPTGPAQRVSRAAGAQWVIFKNAQNPEAAWALMKYLISEEAQYRYLVEGRGGVQLDAMQRYWVQEFNPAVSGITNPNSFHRLNVIPEAYMYASLDRQPGNWNELLRTIVTPMARELERMSVPASSAVQDAVGQINASLREFKEQGAGAP